MSEYCSVSKWIQLILWFFKMLSKAESESTKSCVWVNMSTVRTSNFEYEVWMYISIRNYEQNSNPDLLMSTPDLLTIANFPYYPGIPIEHASQHKSLGCWLINYCKPTKIMKLTIMANVVCLLLFYLMTQHSQIVLKLLKKYNWKTKKTLHSEHITRN